MDDAELMDRGRVTLASAELEDRIYEILVHFGCLTESSANVLVAGNAASNMLDRIQRLAQLAVSTYEDPAGSTREKSEIAALVSAWITSAKKALRYRNEIMHSVIEEWPQLGARFAISAKSGARGYDGHKEVRMAHTQLIDVLASSAPILDIAREVHRISDEQIYGSVRQRRGEDVDARDLFPEELTLP